MNQNCVLEVAANGDGISCLAFQLWERAGCPEGRDLEVWLGAKDHPAVLNPMAKASESAGLDSASILEEIRVRESTSFNSRPSLVGGSTRERLRLADWPWVFPAQLGEPDRIDPLVSYSVGFQKLSFPPHAGVLQHLKSRSVAALAARGDPMQIQFPERKL